MSGSAEKLGLVHVYTPGKASSDSPTLLLLHGTGGDENDLLPLGRSLFPNANILSPRGAVRENGMPRFFRRLSEGVFDLVDLKARARELAEFTERASAAYGFDLDMVYAVGFSNGANMAASLLLLFPRLLAGAVLFRPQVPIVPESKPDLSKVSALILSGRQDSVVPSEEPEKLSAMLKEAGADVSLRWQEAGHIITGDEVRLAAAWLKARVAVEP